MQSTNKEINYQIEKILFDNIYTQTINKVCDRVLEEVYFDTQRKISIDVNRSLYTKVLNQIPNDVILKQYEISK